MKTWGITLWILVLTAALAQPVAAAANWSFYGSARMRTYYHKLNSELSTTTPDDTRTIWGMQGNSRIGAEVKAGDIGGRFEYGGTDNVRVRRLYGTWNFGKGVLLVGKEYTPLDFTMSRQVVLQDLGLNGWGTLFSRKAMVQVEMMKLKIALVSPSTSDLEGRYVNDPSGATSAAVTQTLLPSFEAGYTYITDQLRLRGIAGVSSYKIIDDMNNKDDVHRWVLGASATYTFNPVYIAAQFHYGQNLGTWAIAADWEGLPEYGYGTASTAEPIVKNGDVIDNLGYGYAFECGYVLTEAVRFAAGLGGVRYKLDMSGAEYDDSLAFFLNSQINLTSNVLIVPEIGHLDSGRDGAGKSEGSSSYIGAKWQINF